MSLTESHSDHGSVIIASQHMYKILSRRGNGGSVCRKNLGSVMLHGT